MDMVVLLIILILLLMGVIIVYRADDKKAYEKEITKIIKDKGEMKLTTDVLEILAEEGYRPTLEQNSDRELIIVKINGDMIGLFFSYDDPNCILIKYHICTFESKQRNEVLELINEINTKVNFISLTVEDDIQVYITCSAILYNDANLKNIILRYLEVVVYARNEFWELRKAKVALNY